MRLSECGRLCLPTACCQRPRCQQGLAQRSRRGLPTRRRSGTPPLLAGAAAGRGGGAVTQDRGQQGEGIAGAGAGASTGHGRRWPADPPTLAELRRLTELQGGGDVFSREGAPASAAELAAWLGTDLAAGLTPDPVRPRGAGRRLVSLNQIGLSNRSPSCGARRRAWRRGRLGTAPTACASRPTCRCWRWCGRRGRTSRSSPSSAPGPPAWRWSWPSAG